MRQHVFAPFVDEVAYLARFKALCADIKDARGVSEETNELLTIAEVQMLELLHLRSMYWMKETCERPSAPIERTLRTLFAHLIKLAGRDPEKLTDHLDNEEHHAALRIKVSENRSAFYLNALVDFVLDSRKAEQRMQRLFDHFFPPVMFTKGRLWLKFQQSLYHIAISLIFSQNHREFCFAERRRADLQLIIEDMFRGSAIPKEAAAMLEQIAHVLRCFVEADNIHCDALRLESPHLADFALQSLYGMCTELARLVYTSLIYNRRVLNPEPPIEEELGCCRCW